jgi:hypothetical protein
MKFVQKESMVINKIDIQNDTYLEGFTCVEGTSSKKITFA